MAARGEGLGRVFNVVYTASGLSIPLTQGLAVTFVSADAGSGDQTLTFTQSDSTDTNSPVALNIGTGNDPENLGSRAHVGPDTGGTWTEVAPTGANVFTAGGATNDTIAVTVRAEQLADGYDEVVCTVAGGTCVAIIHDLTVQRKPGNLKSSLVA